ncbi:MAG: DUF6328 family protein [Acidimicrobiales bacterium]
MGSHEEAEKDDDEGVLRERYQELIDELRVVLPGLQVLFAFLLTAPFSGGFTDLDDTERLLYVIALIASTAGLVFLITPVAYHRLSDRRDREDRIAVAIRLKLAGLGALGVSIAAGLAAVVSFVFGSAAAIAMTGVFLALSVALWLVFPMSRRLRLHDDHASA